MTDFVAHDGASAHEKIVIRVWVINSIKCWVKSTERECTNTLRITGPSEAERPRGTGEQVLHRDEEASIRVRWSMGRQLVKDTILTTALVLLSSVASS